MAMEVGVSDTAPIDLEMIYRMAYIKTKRPERRLVDVCLAERAGFEPAVGYEPTHAFQSCDFFLRKASAGGTFRHLYYHWKTRLGTIREH